MVPDSSETDIFMRFGRLARADSDERSRVLTMNRRQLLQRLGIFSVAGAPLLGQRTETASFLTQHPAFDLHCHPGAFYNRGMADYPGDQAFAKTTSEMRDGGLTAAFFSIVGDAKLLTRDAKGIVVSNRKLSDGEAWADCEKQLKTFDELAKRENIGLATSTAHMEELRKRGQIAAFRACEGGHGLEGRLTCTSAACEAFNWYITRKTRSVMCRRSPPSITGCPPSAAMWCDG